MIAAVSEASTSFGETLSTLKFAQRAKMIKNKAVVNEECNGSIDSLKKEIKKLKEELNTANFSIDRFKNGKNNHVNILLLFYCYFIVILLLFYCYFIVILLLFYCYFIVILLLFFFFFYMFFFFFLVFFSFLFIFFYCCFIIVIFFYCSFF